MHLPLINSDSSPDESWSNQDDDSMLVNNKSGIINGKTFALSEYRKSNIVV